jgi:hypothetical protein
VLSTRAGRGLAFPFKDERHDRVRIPESQRVQPQPGLPERPYDGFP